MKKGKILPLGFCISCLSTKQQDLKVEYYFSQENIRLQSSLQTPIDLCQGQVQFASSCRVRNILISSGLKFITNILLRFTGTSTKIKTQDEDGHIVQQDL